MSNFVLLPLLLYHLIEALAFRGSGQAQSGHISSLLLFKRPQLLPTLDSQTGWTQTRRREEDEITAGRLADMTLAMCESDRNNLDCLTPPGYQRHLGISCGLKIDWKCCVYFLLLCQDYLNTL
ncbi:hypothetical protein BKA65DRAFT_491378 [Rhexocercosporidium sp. MPI-PUGE-AT-0058]|nr:hypothetical protein BKA65DRAFT_491378 [Rhexocercosporidium sp. MPI-PUGE-AT-0058]